MSARTVAQAIDACRRGWPIVVRGDAAALHLLPIETADHARLSAFAPEGFDLLLSPERGATLALGNQRDVSGSGAIRIEGAPWIDLDAATALADPSRDLATPLKGPFRSAPLADATAGEAALKLARLASLLPGFFVGSEKPASRDIPDPGTLDILQYDHPSRLRLVSRARLPIAAAEECEIVAFRSAEEAVEHVALLIGRPNGALPLVRLHSECLTGDVLGSLKCDCGPQLNDALAKIAESGWGILLYLRQEGRGVGLINKLRAYALQDQGFDTVDANLRLGFTVDARDFGVAARMLSLLGQTRIRLLTNNPAKVAALREAGVQIDDRVPHTAGANRHNIAYLQAKKTRTGHLL